MSIVKKLMLCTFAFSLAASLGSCELQVPDQGIVAAQCDAQGTKLCNGVCKDITTNEDCGDCGKSCDGGERCQVKDGVLACVIQSKICAAEDEKYCDGKCVNITMREHCGGCASCRDYEKCAEEDGRYRCVNDCEPPNMVCGGKCESPSRNHCGSCGNGCGEDRICKKIGGSYQCVVENCLKPQVLTPEGACVLPNTSHYCGDDAQPCPSNTSDCVNKPGERDVYICQNRCANGRRDKGEKGVDCGGVCKPCKKCSVNVPKKPCDEGEFCDSAIGYLCSKKCVPDNGNANTASKHCREDQICRADGRCSSKYFITRWVVPAGGSVELFHDGKGRCDFNVDWGDGKKEKVEFCTSTALQHRYEKAGTYRVVIDGTYDGWGWKDWGTMSQKRGSASKLEGVVSFGPVGLSTYAFTFCERLNHMPADDVPDASKLTDAESMFAETAIFNAKIGHWDVSNVVNMRQMFWGAVVFNQNIDMWDVSKVTSMLSMFDRAYVMSSDLGRWDTKNVKTMNKMFWEARAFNGDIGRWNVSSVTDMGEMFLRAQRFDRDLSAWDLGSIVHLVGILGGTALSKENYCKMMQNEWWAKYRELLWKSHSCT